VKPEKKGTLNVEANLGTTKPPATTVTKKAGADISTAAKKNESLKHGTSKANNKINERDMNNPKEKDCQIY